jgi:hypothetical protein
MKLNYRYELILVEQSEEIHVFYLLDIQEIEEIREKFLVKFVFKDLELAFFYN